ncbi:hypothetical protein PybrP1_008463 [[Pythium] brassicae (nom. inval.)]|nr:hypothetical protein PybrP1_008463 [[Pythium] brassicae (nom. inval.)]
MCSVLPPANADRLAAELFAQSTLPSAVADALLGSRAGLRRVFHTGDAFPARRYALVREWARVRGSAKPEALYAAVALDRVDGKHVVLTCLAKALVTEWQIRHALRVALTLARQRGLQALLRVWDAGKNWVFVQEFDPAWESVAAAFAGGSSSSSSPRSSSGFAEEKLRDVMKDGKVVMLFNVAYILSGYTLVAANERNKAADVAAVGVLMFQLCMAPFAPEEGNVDVLSIESAIEDQLTAKPTIDELSKRKWLRHVDFISVSSKLEHHHSHAHMRQMLCSSLMWKLAAFFLADWLEYAHALAATPTAATAEDEEVRQRQKKPSKRVLVGRKLLLSGHSPHWLKRGAAIIPPLGSTILPRRDDDGDDDDSGASRDSSSMESVFQAWTRDEIIPTRSSADYGEFAYDFPSLSGSYARAYDAFDWAGADWEAAEAVGEQRDRRSRSIAREHHATVGVSHDSRPKYELQRETLRSLQSGSTHTAAASLASHAPGFSASLLPRGGVHDATDASDSAPPFATEVSTDPLYFSAFGPKDVARREAFRVDIWAYLRQQRDEMLETALEQNEAEVGQHVQPFHIQRGALITVMIEANARFGVHGDDAKTFRWRGDVSGVSFELYRKPPDDGDGAYDVAAAEASSELCIARIIAGTKVSLLYVRLHTRQRERDGERLGSECALLESTLEHVRADVQEIPSQELELIRPIGSGAFGDAMLAKWHDTTDVVVKMLHQDMYRNSDAVAEFQHEAAVMHMLGKHPHVVELLGVCSNLASTADASFSLVTEYLPNGSVQELLQGASLPRDDGAYEDPRRRRDELVVLYDSGAASSPFGLFSRTVMARDAAHGLANIHQGHFLHRDIAARNCLVDAHFRVKVCDFGLSRKLNPSGFMFDDDRHGFGPLKWMAPESILPPHLFSMQSDAYMFGVLLFEIFTGQQPFPALSTREAIALIREGKHVPIPSGLPATHAALMQRCFELHPLHRPTMDQIYSTLDAWVVHDTRAHVVT